jgi:hypothetical protein
LQLKLKLIKQIPLQDMSSAAANTPDVAAIVAAVMAAMAKKSKPAAAAAAVSKTSAAAKKPKASKTAKRSPPAASETSAAGKKRKTGDVYDQWCAWLKTLTGGERTTLMNAWDVCCLKAKDECPHYDSDIDAASSDSDAPSRSRKRPINPKCQAVLDKVEAFMWDMSSDDNIKLLNVLDRCCFSHHSECPHY